MDDMTRKWYEQEQDRMIADLLEKTQKEWNEGMPGISIGRVMLGMLLEHRDRRNGEDAERWKVPELTKEEGLRLMRELPEHPTMNEEHSRILEILARRPQ